MKQPSKIQTTMKKFFSLSLFIFGMAVVLCAQTPQWVNPLPTGQPINDIAFFDAAHALMCGKNGALLSSSDGGNTWLEQSQGDFANFFQIEITGAASALVRAESFLLKTDDYGNSFSVVGTMPAGTTYKKSACTRLPRGMPCAPPLTESAF